MPSKEKIKRLIEHYRKGRYEEAEEQAVLMTQQFPSFMIGWKALGAVLAQKGRISDALFANEKAVVLSPPAFLINSDVSETPLVISAALALSPNCKPSTIPAPMAIIFFIAPAIDAPFGSLLG